MKIIVSKGQLEKVLVEVESKFKLPEAITKAHEKVEKRYGYKVDNSNIAAELKQEGTYYDDAGAVDSTAKKAAESFVANIKAKFPKLEKNKGITSSYRGYDKQVDVFGGGISTAGGIIQRQQYVALPGFSQHHTGKCFDIFSVEPEWWYKNPDVMKYVRDNASKFGFKVSYPFDGYLRKHEPWHILYIG